MPNPIYMIDASSLKKSSCLLRLQRNNILGLRLKALHSYKMAYGTAFHKFLQHWYNGEGFDAAWAAARDYYAPHTTNLPEEAFHTGSHLERAVKLYADTFPEGGDMLVPRRSQDGKAMQEWKFSFPWHKGSNFELALCGTIDMLASYAGQEPIVDHKTSSSFQKDSYFQTYELDIQTMLYSYVCKEFLGFSHYPPVLINGLFLKRPTAKAEKAGYFDGAEFRRSNLISYSDAQMANFVGWLEQKKQDIITFLESGVSRWPADFAACKQSFSLCDYWQLCRQGSDQEVEEAIIEQNYNKSPYNPLAFQD